MAKAVAWQSIDDIAKHLGVSTVTIYRWLEKAAIPAHRVGKLWKFQITEIDDWVRKGGADYMRNRSTHKEQKNG